MSVKMTNEQKLELIAKAMELGASIEIKFYKDAKEEADHITDQLELDFEKRSNNGTHWLCNYDWDNKIDCTVFYNEEEELPFADESIFLEDDIFLDDPHAS